MLLSTKVVAATLLMLPATSVAVALTVTAPSPRVERSALLSNTACAEPVPVAVRVLLTLWPLALNLTSTLAPDSAATTTAPALPPAMLKFSMPAVAIRVGLLGATVSTVTVAEPARLTVELSRARPAALAMLPPLSRRLAPVPSMLAVASTPVLPAIAV